MEIFRHRVHYAAPIMLGVAALVAVAIGFEDGRWDAALGVYAVMAVSLLAILWVCTRFGYRNTAAALAIEDEDLLFEPAHLLRRQVPLRMRIAGLSGIRRVSQPAVGGGRIELLEFDHAGQTYKIPLTGASFVDAGRIEALFPPAPQVPGREAWAEGGGG